MDAKILANLATQLSALLPSGLHSWPDDIQANIHAILQAAFAKLDLVTREEFDVQVKLLARARERILSLEEKIKMLESTL